MEKEDVGSKQLGKKYKVTRKDRETLTSYLLEALEPGEMLRIQEAIASHPELAEALEQIRLEMQQSQTAREMRELL